MKTAAMKTVRTSIQQFKYIVFYGQLDFSISEQLSISFTLCISHLELQA